MAKKVFYYSEKELECLKWVSRVVDFGVSLAVISAFNEMYSALYHLRTNKKIFRFTVKKHCNQAIEAALIREQELKSNMINKSFWLDYSDHIIDEAAPDIAKFRSAIKNELDKTALCSSELYSYVECARVLLEMSVKQYDGVMEECKEVLDNLIEQVENYVRRNYSRDSKLIKLIGRIKAVRDVQRKRGSTLLDPKVIDALVSNLRDEWIPVKDRLPETKEKVLVTHRSGVAIASLYDSESQIWIANGGKPHRLKTVIAWQKLPEPYRKEKHGKINV